MKITNACWVLILATGCTGKIVLVEGAGAAAGAMSNLAGGPGNTGGAGDTGGEYGPVGGGTAADPTTSGGAGECADTALPADVTRPGYFAARDPSVTALLNSMSSEAKIKQLYGVPNPPNRDGMIYYDLTRAQDVDLGNGKALRGYRYRIGGRGVTLADGQDNRASQGKDYSTAFPAPSVRAASWDVDLEMRVGEGMGDETMASRNNLLIAPCVNIVRHPYWGRTQETYGEDMYHIGRMGSAFAAGVQKHVPACATHFAANNIEQNRSNQNALMDEQTLREVYGRHFEMVVREGGVACVMAAYNMINGIKSTQNRHLLTDILRGSTEKGGMGFRGFVISDWWAMPGDQKTPDTATAQAVARDGIDAGLDVELPWGLYYSQLSPLLSSGLVSQANLDTAAGRVIEQKVRFNSAYTDSPWGLGTARTKLSGDSITANEANLALAEEAEIKSAVLLTNGTSGAPVLPIRNAASIAVVGLDVRVQVSAQTLLPATGDRLKFASDVNLGDRGSNRVNADPAMSIGPFAGIKAVAASHNANTVTTGTSVEAAMSADFVVVVVGLTAGDEGEEYSLNSLGDRRSLSLGLPQESLVNDVLSLNKPTAIIVESGSIVELPWLSHSNRNQATIWAGYGGQRVGAALGKLLFGDANFSGKMPLAWPRESDLPAFTGSDLSTRMDYFFGYRYYDDLAAKGTIVDLVFPFGWGLSYSEFRYSNLATVNPSCETAGKRNVVTYVVDVTNTGAADGEEVVMLFVKGPPKPSSIMGNRPVKELKSFAKVRLAAGQTSKVQLPLSIQELRHWEGDTNGKYVIDNGVYTIMVGPNASEASLSLMAQLAVHD